MVRVEARECVPAEDKALNSDKGMDWAAAEDKDRGKPEASALVRAEARECVPAEDWGRVEARDFALTQDLDLAPEKAHTSMRLLRLEAETGEQGRIIKSR